MQFLIQKNNLSQNDFIVPLFIIEGKNKKEKIESMPDYYRYSIDLIKNEVKKLWEIGLKSVLLFVKVDESRLADICAEESSKLKVKLSQDSTNSSYSEMDDYDLLYIPQDNTTKELIKDKHLELENSMKSRLIPPYTCENS